MAEIKTQIYDFGIDNLRDVTDADVERWKNDQAFCGIRVVITRALIEAERQVWVGTITWDTLVPIKEEMLKLLNLDMNAKLKTGDR